MKKSLLTLGAAFIALTSFASTRILYNQDFESVGSPAEAGWTYGGATLTLVSDGEGKYLELALGQNNGRSGVSTWGQDIFMEDGEVVLEDDGIYNVDFEFSVLTGSNNQYNGCITLFTNHAPVTNQPYRTPWSPAGYWQNYLYDMSQVNGQATQYVVNGGTVEVTDSLGTVTGHEIDFSDTKSLVTFEEGKWYSVHLVVDVNNRSVEYDVVQISDKETVASGTLEVPAENVNGDPITMFAEGLFVMTARYQQTIGLDNIQVYFEPSYDWANKPTIAMTGLGVTPDEKSEPTYRAYTIKFLEGETLHVIGTDGQEIVQEYEDCDGAYVYETYTSGELKAWTVVGDVKSEEVSVAVECEPVTVPQAVATITAVSEGYGKTYTLTVDNTDVPMRPSISMEYKFVGESGAELSGEDIYSGATVTVAEAGTLTITTNAWGYASNTVTVKNDIKFEEKKSWDFARLTKEEIVAAGFPAEFTVLNSSETKGFNNWTARKRLNYISTTETKDVIDEEGNVVGTEPATIYPFGFIAEDNTTNVVEYSVIDRAAIAETTKDEYFKGLTIFPERGKVAEGGLPNVGMLYRIGLYNDQTTNTNNNVYVNDLDESDFVVVNYINDYGSNSNHPSVATDEEYFAVLAGADAVISVAKDGTANEETGLYDVAYSLYRIDTAITKITVYKPAEGSGDAVEAIESIKAVDNNWYSIDGVRVAEPTRPGLYIHNGKKIIVK
ncbi:MAG: hypothetical protein K2K32_07460, partial [Muribaculaceae bacterium]|nr:hypothetical protein [Muribaculaceae bacterium]